MDIKERLNKIMQKKFFIDKETEQKIMSLLDELIKIPVKKNTILLIESHLGHSEVYPSVINYFIKLGFSVHLFVLEENIRMNSLCRCSFPKEKFQYFVFPKFVITTKFIETIQKYTYIINETFLTHEGYFFSLQLEENLKKNNYYGIIHNVCTAEELENSPEKRLLDNDKAFVLRNNIYYKSKEIPFILLNYFGNIRRNFDISYKRKFIVVGGGNKKNLRNFDLLFESVERLIDENFSFELILIGITPDRISSYITDKNNKVIRFLGRVTADVLYNELEQSDFILYNIDKSCDDYGKYLNGGITGSYSLSLAFGLPGICEKELAEAYGIQNLCITYSNNLYEALHKAMMISLDEYKKLCIDLVEYSQNLQTVSFHLLEKIFIKE